MNYRRIPFVNKLLRKFDLLNSRIEFLETEINYLYSKDIERTHLEKSHRGEKINVVFICHRPQVWNSLKTVFDQCNNDSDFNVTIVAIPLKKQLQKIGFDHEQYETEGAEEFFKEYKCRVINGYDYEAKKWFDLRSLNPDYVFFQQPYNVAKYKTYKSWEVAKYATICHVNYYYDSCKELGFQCIPEDFVKNVSLYFMQNESEKVWLTEYFDRIDNNFTRLVVSGFPRFDLIQNMKNAESEVWKKNNESDFKIIWTPRWTTNENNCHFFEYKDKFLEYCDNHSDVDFVFRPHPQAFLNWIANRELTESEAKSYKENYDKRINANIDNTKDYLPVFYSSSCMVTDFSSVVPEYFLTGKPIVYCYNEKSLYNNEGKFTEGFYYVKNWKELEDTLEMLKSGKDPLREKRMELIKSEFYVAEGGAGLAIKETIKKHFRGEL